MSDPEMAELNRLRTGVKYADQALDALEAQLLREEYDTPARHVKHVHRTLLRLTDTRKETR